MNNRVDMGSTRNLILFVICLIFFSGCAAYSNKDLPVYNYDQIQQNANKSLPGIDYKIEVFDHISGEKNKVKLMSNGVVIDKNTLIRRISYVFPKSNLFSNIEMGEGKYPLHVDFSLEVNQHMLPVLTAIPSIFTLTLFPFWDKNEFILTAKVSLNYNLIKTYEYSDWISVYNGILLLPMAFSADKKYQTVQNKVFDQLLLNFLHDIQKDIMIPEKI